MGTAINKDNPVTNKVPMKIEKRPNSPFSGFQREENNKSEIEKLVKIKADLYSRRKKIRKKIRETNIVTKNINFVQSISLIFLLFIMIFFPNQRLRIIIVSVMVPPI